MKKKSASFFAKHELTYSTGIDVSGIAKAYKVEGIPCLVLVDAKGIIQGRKIGFSPGSLDAVRKDIETVLDGHDLESAKPMSEEELQEVRRAASEHRHWREDTRLNTNFFRVRWERRTASEANPEFMDRSPIMVHIPPRFLLVREADTLFLLDPETGHTNRTVRLPAQATATNEMGHFPKLCYMQVGNTGYIAGLQTYYRVESEDSQKSFRSDRTEIFCLTLDGEVLWSKSSETQTDARFLDALPISDTEDLLILSGWHKITLMNSKGETLLTQHIWHSDRIDIFKSDAETGLSGYFQGSKVAAFDFMTPSSKSE